MDTGSLTGGQQQPKEYPFVLEIIVRWKSGQSMNSIATWLNKLIIKSPMNKKWSLNSIDNIFKESKADILSRVEN